MKRAFCTLSVGLAFVTSSAFADVIIGAGGFGPTPTDFSTPIVIPQFNPALGTLNSINISLTGQTAGLATVTNNSGVTGTYLVDLFATLALLDPTSATLLTNSPDFNSSLTILDGHSATTFGLSPLTTESVTLTSGFAPYVGTGDATFTVNGTGNAGVSGPTAFTVTSLTSGLANLTVTYNFQPVPEPSYLTGFVGLGLFVSGMALYRKLRPQRQ